MTEYTPSKLNMRRWYVAQRIVDGVTRAHAEQEFTRFLAQVRRDAWDEALTHAETSRAIFGDDADDMRADNPYKEETP